MWGRIIAFCAKYGTKAVSWAWRNKWKLLSLGEGVWDFIQGVWGN